MKDQFKRKRQEGFSIIEVLIVLAIAGLLMAVVFIAVPQLQRNARDNTRQNLVNRLKTEMETYSGNNQGRYPLDPVACAAPPAANPGRWCDFFNRYVSGDKIDVTDPNGTEVVAAAPAGEFRIGAIGTAGGALPDRAGELSIIRGAKCDGEGVSPSGTTAVNTKNFAMVIGLDRDNTVYCVDNG